ncbi:MAG: hypothetical protein PVF75_05290 [Granulosicoccaceae bacterium]|jgi:hypothetical protein
MNKLAVLAAATLFAATSLSASAADKKSAAATINDAVNATIAAQKVGGEWRDTFKMIGKAKAAYKKGDYETAEKLAGKAKHQGEMGKAQALAEKNASHASLH